MITGLCHNNTTCLFPNLILIFFKPRILLGQPNAQEKIIKISFPLPIQNPFYPFLKTRTPWPLCPFRDLSAFNFTLNYQPIITFVVKTGIRINGQSLLWKEKQACLAVKEFHFRMPTNPVSNSCPRGIHIFPLNFCPTLLVQCCIRTWVMVSVY